MADAFDPEEETAAQDAEFREMTTEPTIMMMVPEGKVATARLVGDFSRETLPSVPFTGEPEVTRVLTPPPASLFDGDPEEIIEISGIAGKRRVLKKFADDLVAGSGNPGDPPARFADENGLLLCGKLKRNGEPCENRAGAGTEHLGEGPCRLHGGNAGRPIEHGRYSNLAETAVGKLLEGQLIDTEWQDISEDVKLARALLIKWIEEYDEWLDAILAWNASFQSLDKSPKPVKVLELQDGINYLSKIARMVEGVKKAEAMNAISRPDLMRILGHMMRVVQTLAPEKAEEIAKQWLQIHI